MHFQLPRKLVALGYLAFGLVCSNSAVAAPSFERSLYLNVNMGYSSLEPKSDCDCHDITDTNDGGVEIALGYDLFPRVSLEGYYADLGQATVRDLDEGKDYSVEYHSAGINILGYLFARDYSWRGARTFSGEPFSPYIKLGAGQIDNDSSLVHDRPESFQAQFGLGVEFSLGSGFAARTAVTAYGGDANMFSIGLVKRFGLSGSAAPKKSRQVSRPQQPVIAQSQPRPQQIPKRSGPLFSLALPTLYFAPGSADLAKQDKRLLLNLASEIRNYYKVKVLIKGYADDASSAQGGDLMLSLKRAMHVKNLLIGFGVPRSQLDAQGLGDADLEGLAKQPTKRRVEFDIDFR